MRSGVRAQFASRKELACLLTRHPFAEPVENLIREILSNLMLHSWRLRIWQIHDV